MTRKYFAAMASVGLVALAIAGCGSSGGGNSSPMAAAASTSGPAVNATNTALGKIVTDTKGRTLYQFTKDTGTMSSCTGACASEWLPFTATSKPSAGDGVSGAITLVKRADGAKQVALDGHPLYYFVGDQSAGQANGQGVDDFGAKWFAVGPSGAQVTAVAKSNSGGNSSSSGSNGGYSY
jgi:predicted lipoprotein with Yx(FWY)xxD motif